MEIKELIKRLKGDQNILPYTSVWQGIFLRLNIYISGIKPNYCINKDENYQYPSQREIEGNEKYTPIFDNEIFCRYPHDSHSQLNFRKSIAHVDDMKSLCDKFFQQSKSILFQGNNFTVSTNDKILSDWLATVRIAGFGFDEWVKNVLYHMMINDPNALCCILESHMDAFTEGEKAIPMPHIFPSELIKYLDNYNAVVPGYALDRNTQYRLDGDGELLGVEYNHRIGELPVFQLGGKYISPFIWHSFIQSFVGIANSYLQEKSDVAIAKKTLAPRLQIIQSDCSECNGSGHVDRVEGREACKLCRGKGKISINLGDIVSIPETRALLDDGKIAQLDRFKYTTPDPKYIELLNNDADTEFMRAEKSLFIHRKETAASESSNNLDKQFEEKKIFFQSIADRLHYTIDKIIYFVSMYLNYNAGNPKPSFYEVVRPMDFDLTSADDALVQYANEKKNLLPTFVTNSSELNYIRKVYGENSPVLKKVEFLQLYDPLYGKGSEYVSSLQGIDPMDITTHNYLSSLLALHINDITVDAYMVEPHRKTWDKLYPLIVQKNGNVPTLL